MLVLYLVCDWIWFDFYNREEDKKFKLKVVEFFFKLGEISLEIG